MRFLLLVLTALLGLAGVAIAADAPAAAGPDPAATAAGAGAIGVFLTLLGSRVLPPLVAGFAKKVDQDVDREKAAETAALEREKKAAEERDKSTAFIQQLVTRFCDDSAAARTQFLAALEHHADAIRDLEAAVARLAYDHPRPAPPVPLPSPAGAGGSLPSSTAEAAHAA